MPNTIRSLEMHTIARRPAHLVLPFLLVALAVGHTEAQSEDNSTAKEWARLNGSWELIHYADDGKVIGGAVDRIDEFKDGEWTLRSKNTGRERVTMSVKLDPRKKPA